MLKPQNPTTVPDLQEITDGTMIHRTIAGSVQLDQPFRLSGGRVWSLHEAREMEIDVQIHRRGRLARLGHLLMNVLEEWRGV